MSGGQRMRLIGAVLLFGAAALFASHAAAAETMSAERQQEVLRGALNAYDQAVAAAESPARAAELYRESAAGFESLARAGVRNAALEYNLGNAYFRLGQLGRAIMHYRRAALLAPADAKLNANLEYARRQVEPYIAESGQDRLRRQVLFLHYRLSLLERFWGAAVLAVLGWLLLGLRLRWPTRPLFVAGLVGVVLSLSLAASVAWDLREGATTPAGVIVASEPVVLRLGRGETTEAALKQGLGAGVEVRILQERGGWVEVQLANGQTGWLPAAAVERV